MTEQELKDLKHRCKYAVAHGFGMAKTDELAAELVEDGATKPRAKHPSPADLLKMVVEVEASFDGSGHVYGGVHGHTVVDNVQTKKPVEKIVVHPIFPPKAEKKDEVFLDPAADEKSEDDR